MNMNYFKMLAIKIDVGAEIGCELAKKLKEDSSIRVVCVGGRINDPVAVKIILSAIKGTQVSCLHFKGNLICSDGAKYMAEGIKETNISQLILKNNALQITALEYLPSILKDTCITKLYVAIFENTDTFFKHLANGLKSSSIYDLHVEHTENRIDILKYLVDVLLETNITRLTLNKYDEGYTEFKFALLSVEEVKYVETFLKNSCITHFNMNILPIESDVPILRRTLANTQIIHIHSEFGQISELIEVTSKNKILGNEIQKAFKKLVIENIENKNLDFVIPNETKNIDIGAYLDFIKTITNNPNAKRHIISLIESLGLISSNKIRKINEFIKTISDKFNQLFNNKLLNLLGDFDYIDLVKKCDDMELHDIVKNLLLHRHLYYVDDGQEILHPFIYKMLNKYEMTLYMEQIEPKKKNEIISYYENHQEIDGAQEIVDLLESQPL